MKTTYEYRNNEFVLQLVGTDGNFSDNVETPNNLKRYNGHLSFKVLSKIENYGDVYNFIKQELLLEENHFIIGIKPELVDWNFNTDVFDEEHKLDGVIGYLGVTYKSWA